MLYFIFYVLTCERYPHGVTESIDGSTLYIAEFGFHSVRIIDLSTALVTTLAGNGLAGDVDGTGTFASFYCKKIKFPTEELQQHTRQT